MLLEEIRTYNSEICFLPLLAQNATKKGMSMLLCDSRQVVYQNATIFNDCSRAVSPRNIQKWEEILISIKHRQKIER